MPIITKKLTGYGAVIELLVGVHESKRRMLMKHHMAIPDRQRVLAQIDTGSPITVITSRIPPLLGISPLDFQKVRTLSTSGEVLDFPSYPVSVSLDVNQGIELHLPEWIVCAAWFDPEEGIEAILGLDALKECFFFCDGPKGSYSIAY